MANELKGLQRLRGLVAERDGHGGDIPVWLALEWIDDAIKRVADEPSEVEYVREMELHEHRPECDETGCVAVIRAPNRPEHHE